MMASRRSPTDPTARSEDGTARSNDGARANDAARANAATKWWRIAVLIYVPALVLSVVGSILNWDAMIEALINPEPGMDTPTPDQARNFLMISTGIAVFMQGLVAAVCWFLAGHLRRGSDAARMILTVAAGVFAVNALMSLVAMGGGGDDVGAMENAVTILIAIASAVSVYATVQAWRDGRG